MRICRAPAHVGHNERTETTSVRVEPGASFVGLRLRFSCAESDCALVSLSVAVTALWLFSAAIRRDTSRSSFPLVTCVLRDAAVSSLQVREIYHTKKIQGKVVTFETVCEPS